MNKRYAIVNSRREVLMHSAQQLNEAKLSLSAWLIQVGIFIRSQEDQLISSILQDNDFSTQVFDDKGERIIISSIPLQSDGSEKIWQISFEQLQETPFSNRDGKYDLVISNHDQSVCQIDEKGNIINANENFKKLALRITQNVERLNVLELIDEEFQDEVQDTIKATFLGISRQINIALTLKDRQRVFLHVSTLPMISETKITGIYCIVEDVTMKVEEREDRLKAEHFLEKFHAEEKLQQAVNQLLADISRYIDLEIAEFWLSRQDGSTHLYASLYPTDKQLQEFIAVSSNIGIEEKELHSKHSSLHSSTLFFNDHFPRKKEAISAGVKTGFSVPVMFKGERIAVFTFLSLHDKLSRSRLKFVKLIASHISFAIAYRKNYEALNEVFELIPDMICTFDKSGRILKANHAFYNFVSHEKQKLHDFVNETDVIADTLLDNVLNQKIIEGQQFRIITHNGLPLWTEWSFSYNESENVIYGVANNIQSRKIYDLALRANNEKFYLLGKSTNDLIYEKDFATGKVEWGEAFQNLYEIPHETLFDRISFWEESIEKADQERVISDFRMTLYRKQEIWIEEYRINLRNGKQKHILDRGTVVYEGAKASKLIGMMQDITPLKRNEELLTSLNNALQLRALQLSESNKELESFAYIVSHDLQEPLRMISSFLKLLMDNKEKRFSEKEVEYIRFALDGAERMKKMILDLLTYARVGTNADDFELVDLNNVIEQVKLNYKEHTESGKLQIHSNKLPVVKAVKVQMEQIFSNLLSNAIKYNESNIIKIRISVKDEPEQWLLSVEDNGIGIDEKYRNDVFILFKRLHPKSKYSGTGIGLAVCKKIIQRHRGKLWVESNPSGGSIFYFTLPKS
ncbi:MAG: ATP-binding protein [Flavobacteriales bacterium]